jgi:hypothetical protein
MIAMKSLFPSYYRYSDEEWRELWHKCVFILDTNVLLNLYRYNKDTSDDLLRILKAVSDRLWIPYQVALEYQENRERVAVSQLNIYDKVGSILHEVKQSLQDGLSKLELEERHYSIDPSKLVDGVEALLEDFSKELNRLRENQPSLHTRLRDEIDQLLDGKIGPAPDSQEDLDQLCAQAETRYQERRPPGFMDADKGAKTTADLSSRPFFFNHDIRYPREYGDVILWLQTIETVKLRGWKQVLFVTDDQKGDWWREIDGRRIGPRIELIDEMRAKSGVSLFHMHNSARFMQYAQDYLEVEIKQESIDQVRELTKPEESREAEELVEEVRMRWPEVLNALRPVDLKLEALLRTCEPMRVDDGNTVVLGFRHRFHLARVSESESKALAERIISAVLGRPMQIRPALLRE